MSAVHLTMLNGMASRDIEEAIALHVGWGLKHLDLKDALYGKGIADLDDREAARVRTLADEAGLKVYCLSTGLFLDDIEKGETHFRACHLDRLTRILEIADALGAAFIRLLAARSVQRDTFTDLGAHLDAHCPWLALLYAEAFERITARGFRACVENEVEGCIFRTPADVIAFFERAGDAACFTYDIQNMWQAGGVFPSAEAYRQLRSLTGYFHLKGGIADQKGGPLKWSSSLEDASWPVTEIMRQVVADGISPVVCLNPSHGGPMPGYDYAGIVKRDIDFLRREIEGVA